jgi:hypothetical protein
MLNSGCVADGIFFFTRNLASFTRSMLWAFHTCADYMLRYVLALLSAVVLSGHKVDNLREGSKHINSPIHFKVDIDSTYLIFFEH